MKRQKIVDQKVKQYNQVSFISKDPNCIPHLFQEQQEIEIDASFGFGLGFNNR